MKRDRLKADLQVNLKTVMSESNQVVYRYGLKEQMFARVDYCFIQIQALCQLVEERLSWSVGQQVRKLATPVHEVFLKACRRAGCGVIDSAAMRFARAELPRELPQSPSFTLKSEGVSPLAEDLLHGRCQVDETRSVKIEELSWSQDPFGESWGVARLNFHCLDWVRELVDGYSSTSDQSYLDQAQNLTRRWISQCLWLERHPVVWDDHATALRLIIMCQLWVVCRFARAEDAEFMREVISAVLRHGRRLEHERFYRANHNHGITQAYALIVAGCLFPWLPEASNWVDLGRLRLERQMFENVSDEGMHREHSPYYHFYVFNQFLYAYQFGAAYGIEFSQQFVDRLKKMLRCAAYILKPNGTLPAIGDTCMTSPILLRPEDVIELFSEASRMYLYSYTAGVEGIRPEANSLLLKEAGVAVLRSGWGSERPFQDEVFATIRTCTFNTSHIHRDQLSFELYAYGGDLIVDSGGPYAYGDPLREYFLSTSAHNTVVVDGRNQDVGVAGTVDWCTTNAFDLLVVEQRSYPTVVHRRTIIFVRSDYFVVIDRLYGDALHTYTQLFHLSPSLTAHLKGRTISTTRQSTGPTIQIISLIEEGITVDLQIGINDSAKNWVCQGEAKRVPNTVVAYQQIGSRAEFAVLLVPQPFGASIPVCAKMEDSAVSNGRRIRVTMAEHRDEIFIDKNNKVTVSRLRLA